MDGCQEGEALGKERVTGPGLSIKATKRPEEENSDPEDQFYEKQGVRDLARFAGLSAHHVDPPPAPHGTSIQRRAEGKCVRHFLDGVKHTSQR